MMTPTIFLRNKKDSFSEVLQESADYFASNQINMISGFKEIATDKVLFEEYKDQLVQGLGNETDTANMLQLFENAKSQYLTENHIAQMSPIAGLSMPTIRKMWVKNAVKNVFPTTVAKQPTFAISWMEPYTFTLDPETGERIKVALPQARHGLRNIMGMPKIEHPAEGYYLLHETSNVINHTLVARGEAEWKTHSRTGKQVAKRLPGDAVDTIFYIDSLIHVDELGNQHGTIVNLRLDNGSAFYGTVEHPAEPGRIVQIMGNLSTETGDISLTTMGDIVHPDSTKAATNTSYFEGFTVRGHMTQENNRRTRSVSLDLRKKDIKIGTGEHLTAEFPIEWAQDMAATYSVDVSQEMIDLMSNLTAQTLDAEMIEFLERSFQVSGSPFTAHWDTKPTAGFAGSPLEWRQQLRVTIDWWANRLKSSTLFTFGHFVIMGHPIDIQLIPDLQWTFRGAEGEYGSVNVNYDFGVVTGTNQYHVLATENISDGKLYMFFVPNVENNMTYMYYPYTFNIVDKGYISDNSPNVPSIMMTKRHTIEELIPMQVQIVIRNNNGELVQSYAL